MLAISDGMEDAELQNTRRWKRRKRLVKIILISIALGVLLIGLIIYLASLGGQTCTGELCAISLKIQSHINTEIDPCDDFYEFACGNFLKYTVIPENKVAVNAFTIVSDKVVKQLQNVLQEAPQATDPRFFKLAKQYYKTCVNEDKIESDNLKPMQSILLNLGGWPVLEGDNWKEENFDWKDVIYKMGQLGLDTSLFLRLSITIDTENNNKYVIQVSQPDYGYTRDLYLLKYTEDVIHSYYQYMVELAVGFGANRSAAEEEFQHVMNFRLTLLHLTLSPEEVRNATKQYNPMTIAEMQKKYPFIPWLEYINNILFPTLQVKEDEIILNQTPKFIERLEGVFQIKKRTLANYILWSTIKESISSLPKSIRKIRLNFEKVALGVKEDKPRWKECIVKTHTNMGLITGALYIRKYFDQNSKKKALELVDNLREALLELLRNNDWMDETTKQRALEKAKVMSVLIGYPDELLDDDKLDDFYHKLTITNNLLESQLMINKFMTDFSVRRLHQPVNETEWLIMAIVTASVNAFYVFNKNIIGFPAGILQENFFSSHHPNYVNYGSIGYIIGHEMTHGFDDQGRHFDQTGNKANWWTPASEEAFIKKAQCIIDQYNELVIPEINTTINGDLTQGENIADNSGLKEAYLAYRRWESHQTSPEPQLPNLPFTPRQLFWLSAAETWCSITRPDYLRLAMASDFHSPAKFRVNGPMANLEEFSEDFNCPRGSRMNPTKKCQVW